MTTEQGYLLFDTAIGRCAIAWNANGIRAIALPEPGEQQLCERIGNGAQPQPEHCAPAPIRSGVQRMQALLDGAADDLCDLQLDMSGLSDFHRRVYARTRAIPPGQIIRYGELARDIGMPGAAQAVGQALGANPFPIVVPCHRVVAAASLGGFSASGGAQTKRRMLLIEGALIQGELVLQAGAASDPAQAQGKLIAAKARSAG